MLNFYLFAKLQKVFEIEIIILKKIKKRVRDKGREGV